jgi:hypothetical protein
MTRNKIGAKTTMADTNDRVRYDFFLAIRLHCRHYTAATSTTTTATTPNTSTNSNNYAACQQTLTQCHDNDTERQLVTCIVH